MVDSKQFPPSFLPMLDDACDKAMAYHHAGQRGAAETVYRAVLQAEPKHPVANHQLGVLLLQSQQSKEALTYLLAALEESPETAGYWLGYIDALIQVGQMGRAREVLALGRLHGLEGKAADTLAACLKVSLPEKQIHQLPLKVPLGKKARPSAAEEAALIRLLDQGCFSEGVALARLMTKRFPQHGFGWKILAALLRSQGNSAAALKPAQRSVQLLPRDVQAQTNLGLVLSDLKQLKEAVACHRRALRCDPDFADAHNNLGTALKLQGCSVEAEVSYRKALTLKPNYAEAYNNLGITLYEQKRFIEAEAAYIEALKIQPVYAEACNNMGNALIRQGRLAEAEAFLRQAIAYRPDVVDAYYNLAGVLRELKRFGEAVALFQQVLILKPRLIEAHHNLGISLSDLGHLNQAEACYLTVLEINPEYKEAYNNLGDLLLQKGCPTEAEASYRRALSLKPYDAEVFSNLLFALSHMPQIDRNLLFAEHCRFGEQFEAPLRDSWPQHQNLRDPDRCLQIGFVSPDLHNHAIANFIEPILAELIHYPSVSLHAYYTNVIEDGVTQRIKASIQHWHAVALLSEANLAEKVLADGIDILIDLSGHTGKNRLLTFARKPAPIQASWMGYPGTSGLRAMDYYFADRYFLPPGPFDDQFTEKLAYLPASAPFLPFESAPPINDLPALKVGYLTFGSFNRLSKLSASTIALWAQLLRALPEARMLLGAMPQEGEYDKLINTFAEEGIARERLSFYPRSSMYAYLALHHQVDICLDTFPYAGGTTTLHALWMGVPTLTVAGSTPAGRTGASILAHVGLDAFVAGDATDFVQKGISWASNLAALASLRAELRARCDQSETRHPEVIAASFERALRTMWQRWCAGLPAESFAVQKEVEVQKIMNNVTNGADR